METKTLGLMLVSAFVLVLILGLISAAASLTVSSDTVSVTDTTAQVIVKNTGTVNLTNIDLTISGDFSVSVNTPTPFNLVAGAEMPINITVTSDLSTLGLGTQVVTITAKGTATSPNDVTSTIGKITFENNNFCGVSNPGKLDISIDISNKEGFGDDEGWYPLDKIQVEITVENLGNEDVNNIEIKWGLYDPANDVWIIDESEKDFDLKDGKDKTITIDFQIDPKDIEDASQEDYVFYVKATGETDDTQLDTCKSDSNNINMIVSDDFVVLNNIKFTPETSQCGSDVEVTADVWNIGGDDQDDVSVIIYNPELGLNNQKIDIGNIDSFDKEKLTFKFKIPDNAREKTNTIEFRVLDDNDDVYESDDNDKSVSTASLKVEGSCGVEQLSVLVSAKLESGGKAGENLLVRATVTNSGSKLQTFSVKPSGYSDWASSANVDESSLALGAGESKDVLITLAVNKDVSGEKVLNIDVLSANQPVVSQPYSITIEKSGFNFPGITGNVISGDNWYLWLIGALNVLLVIIIIVIAIRVARG